MCILGCLMFIVYKFAFNSCELIHIEPQHLRNLTNWQKSRALRTKDKSTLIKISAYLEYNMRTEKDDKRDFKEFKLLQMQQAAGQFTPESPNNHNNNQVPAEASTVPVANNNNNNANRLNNLPVASQTGNKHPIPSIPQTEFTSQQLQNSSYQHQNGSQFNQQQISSGYSNRLLTNGKDEKEERFLPLELDQVEMRKQDQDLFKYTLTFNCTTLIMIMKREPNQVSVQKMSVELKVENKKKSKCTIDLNGRQNLFNVTIQNGYARYYCDRELRFNCTNYSSKDTSKPGTLLAQLVINGIEFETGNGTMPLKHHNHEFQGIRKTCSPNDI